MRYTSTRNCKNKASSAQAIARGIAPDGGLYAPESIPGVDLGALGRMCNMDYIGRAADIIGNFLQEWQKAELLRVASSSYSYGKFASTEVAPVKKVHDGGYVLELFHGPTCAFKDMALQMLPHLLTSSLRKTGETRRACILVATSGDTGKAALEGFRDVEGTGIIVFYPRDGVSAVQKLQMVTQSGSNVGVCAVEGNFDDAQTAVKRVFTDPGMGAALDRAGMFFSSANSINWGRLVPQIAYYFSAYCDLVRKEEIRMGERINVCVPTGNFGNILAAYYAVRMGLPVGKLICASNVNNVLTDFIRTGVYDRNRAFHTTISPSMDILISSNVERLLYEQSGGDCEKVSVYMKNLSETGRYALDTAELEKLRELFASDFCDDEQAKKIIKIYYENGGYLADPHTAVALFCAARYKKQTGDGAKCLVVSTASPFKFCESVLSALDGGSYESSPDLLRVLSEKTGIPIPRPLAGLDGAEIRFEMSVKKNEIDGAVRKLLGLY